MTSPSKPDANVEVERAGLATLLRFGADPLPEEVRDYCKFRRFRVPIPLTMTVGRVMGMWQRSTEVEVKDYAPDIFADIRKRLGVSEEAYRSAWQIPLASLKPKLGAGRSGSLFIRSVGDQFLIKTLPKHEVQALLTILKRYHQHLIQHPSSMLIRFVGLHRFSTASRTLYLFVSNNVIHSPPALPVHQIYDLKGRAPKPGKHLRLEKTPQPDLAGRILKDNDVNRSWIMSSQSRRGLLAVLRHDLEFLESNSLMDYSLLIGVHQANQPYTEPLSSLLNLDTTYPDPALQQSPAPTSPPSASASASASSTPTLPSSSPPSSETSLYGWGSVHTFSADRNEVFTFGIIDFLAFYGVKKMAANMLKSFLWEEEQLSTVPASYYAGRLRGYVKTIVTHPTKDLKREKSKWSLTLTPSSHEAESRVIRVFFSDCQVIRKFGLQKTWKSVVVFPRSTLQDILHSLCKRVVRGMTSADAAEFQQIASRCSFFRVDEQATLPEAEPLTDMNFQPYPDGTLQHLMFHSNPFQEKLQDRPIT